MKDFLRVVRILFYFFLCVSLFVCLCVKSSQEKVFDGLPLNYDLK